MIIFLVFVWRQKTNSFETLTKLYASSFSNAEQTKLTLFELNLTETFAIKKKTISCLLLMSKCQCEWKTKMISLRYEIEKTFSYKCSLTVYWNISHILCITNIAKRKIKTMKTISNTNHTFFLILETTLTKGKKKIIEIKRKFFLKYSPVLVDFALINDVDFAIISQQ